MSLRAHLQGRGQRTAADIYRAHEGKTVDEVAAALGVSRYAVQRASRRYGVSFAGLDARKAGEPTATGPRPGTRHVWISQAYAPQGEDRVRITLPKEPWD